MSTPVGANGQDYAYPTDQETGYASQATGWATAVTAALNAIGRGDSGNINSKAVIDLNSTSQGILVPRMTTTQISAITSPPESLLVYDTTLRVFKYYRNSAWVSLGSYVEGNFDVNGDLDVSGSGIFGAALSALSLAITNAITAASATFTDTTDATNSTSGSLIIAGGVGIAKKLFIGTDLDVAGKFNQMPSGTIISSIRNSVPTGFLLCDGAEYTRASFSELFSVMPSSTSTVTMTIASPCVVTWTSHGLATGQSIQFTTTGSLPTFSTVQTVYYIRKIDANTFHLYTSLSNAMNINATTGRINTSGTQSGIHTGLSYLYGNGNGSTTFNIPDLRGASPRGAGTSSGYIEPAILTLGEKTDDQFQGHVHDYLSILGAPPVYGGGGSYESANQNTNTGIPKDNGTYGTSRIGRETRAKTQAVNFYIKF